MTYIITPNKKSPLENPALKFPQSVSDFFQKLLPIETATDSISFLRDCKLFDVLILTAPSIHNPLCYTEKRLWVENHLGSDMVERLIISSHKGLNKGDYLIDNYAEGRGQENFESRVLQFASMDFPDWESILKYFRATYDLD